jgi:YfiH family protein
VSRMVSKALSGPQGPYFDLSRLFPDGVFAYMTLRGFSGVDPGTLASFLGGQGRGAVDVAAVRQVHSGRVVDAGQAPCEADAVIARGAGGAARIVTADCVPVLLAREDGSACAAVHAGWKGSLAGIAITAARLLNETGTHPLTAYIGPAIGACCYGVPPERRAAFREAFPEYPEEDFGPPGYLDLPSLNRRMLLEAGLLPAAVHVEACCTACSPALCWSYRRDGASAGRMAAVVGRPGAGRHRPG